MHVIDERFGVGERVVALGGALQGAAEGILKRSEYLSAGVEQARAFGMEALGVAQKEILQAQIMREAQDPALAYQSEETKE